MICSVVLVVIMKYNSLLLIEAHSPVDDYDHEKVPAHSFKEHQSLLALGLLPMVHVYLNGEHKHLC